MRPARRSSPTEIIEFVLLIAGLLAATLSVRIYQPLDQDYFLIASIVLFFLPVGLHIYINWRDRSARHSQTLPIWMYLGPLLMASIVFSNGAFDRHPAEQKIVTVDRKWISHSRSGRHYRVEFLSWRHRIEKITVTRPTFDSLEAGGPMQLNVHQGWLGLTWIGGVQAARPTL